MWCKLQRSVLRRVLTICEHAANRINRKTAAIIRPNTPRSSVSKRAACLGTSTRSFRIICFFVFYRSRDVSNTVFFQACHVPESLHAPEKRSSGQRSPGDHRSRAIRPVHRDRVGSRFLKHLIPNTVGYHKAFARRSSTAGNRAPAEPSSPHQ